MKGIEIQQVAFHRNGICGVGFHAVRFRSDGRDMLGIVYDEPGYCSVLDIAKLADPAVGVRFGANSWRGDQFESELRRAITETTSDGAVRVGPFGIPN